MIITNVNVKRCLSLNSEIPEKNICTPRRRGIRHIDDEVLCNEKEKDVLDFDKKDIKISEETTTVDASIDGKIIIEDVIVEDDDGKNAEKGKITENTEM